MAQSLNSTAERDYRPTMVDSLTLPPVHPGLSAALRQAYAPPLDEMGPEFQRLIARLD